VARDRLERLAVGLLELAEPGGALSAPRAARAIAISAQAEPGRRRHHDELRILISRPHGDGRTKPGAIDGAERSESSRRRLDSSVARAEPSAKAGSRIPRLGREPLPSARASARLRRVARARPRGQGTTEITFSSAARCALMVGSPEGP
jgi:hypothetical protein